MLFTKWPSLPSDFWLMRLGSSAMSAGKNTEGSGGFKDVFYCYKCLPLFHGSKDYLYIADLYSSD